MTRLQAEVVERIGEVLPQDWDGLEASGNPFLRHAFLESLEACACVGEESGWQPRHVLVREPRGTLVAAIPQYLKLHSWGEFIFDWSWAQASRRAGIEYYPKLLSAIPFTPVSGPRLLVSADADRGQVLDALPALLQDVTLTVGASGAHVNFTTPEDQAVLEAAGFLRRHDCRFLWRNRDYVDFEAFLGELRADKRKKLRRERRRVEEAGIRMRTLAGEDLASETWQTIFGFSERTFLRHGMAHYLNAEFFQRVSQRLPGTIVVKLAEREGEAIAAAIFFEGGDGLYGRYWGSAGYEDCLHFEACYYQGIEHCIERGLRFFDPGTQGEHKLARGFEPTVTTSAHWLVHDGLAAAIGHYLERERSAVDDYVTGARRHLPFRHSGAT